mmetsp:Transcript_4363/g.12655  ORF Transcript_4363/g.12655 Transcript_4363/m.12655 type:complete len:164 (-) Transcript_4363:448-939(-)
MVRSMPPGESQAWRTLRFTLPGAHGGDTSSPERNRRVSNQFEAFMVVTMLRLGLHTKEAAVLFGVSPGAVSQICNSFVPLYSCAVEAWIPWPSQAMIRANLPKEITEALVRTSLSSRCRIILDATELEMQISDDAFRRALYLCVHAPRAARAQSPSPSRTVRS